MCRVIGSNEMVVRDFRIDLRRRYGGVAEKLLNNSDVGTVGQHVGGTRVS